MIVLATILLLMLLDWLRRRVKKQQYNTTRLLEQADALHDAWHRRHDAGVRVDGNMYRFGKTCNRITFERIVRHGGKWMARGADVPRYDVQWIPTDPRTSIVFYHNNTVFLQDWVLGRFDEADAFLIGVHEIGHHVHHHQTRRSIMDPSRKTKEHCAMRCEERIRALDGGNALVDRWKLIRLARALVDARALPSPESVWQRYNVTRMPLEYVVQTSKDSPGWTMHYLDDTGASIDGCPCSSV